MIDAFSRIIRLGEGVSASGRLSEPPSSARMEALKVARPRSGAIGWRAPD